MEHEKLGFNLGDNSRMDYAQIEAMLRKLESRFGWVPIIEAGRCVRCAWGGRGTTVLLWLGVIFSGRQEHGEWGEIWGWEASRAGVTLWLCPSSRRAWKGGEGYRGEGDAIWSPTLMVRACGTHGGGGAAVRIGGGIWCVCVGGGDTIWGSALIECPSSCGATIALYLPPHLISCPPPPPCRYIGLTYEGQSVTLEPGGQFELSGAPVETIHKTCAEVNSHLYQVEGRAFLRGEMGTLRYSTPFCIGQDDQQGAGRWLPWCWL